jgi:hypothetical protein
VTLHRDNAQAQADVTMAQVFVRSFMEQPDALVAMAATLDFTCHIANHAIEGGADGDLALRRAFRFMVAMTDELKQWVPRSALIDRKWEIARQMPGCEGRFRG